MHSDAPHTGSPRLIRVSGRPRLLLAGLRYRIARVCRPAFRLPPEELLKNLSLHDPNARQISFTFAVIALSARVACADTLTPRKYALFRESFPLQDDMCSKIRSLFVLACNADTPLDHYIAQVRYAFPGQKALLEALLDRLFRIAAAEGELSGASEQVLAAIAHGLDMDATTYNRTLARHLKPNQPYQILGLKKRAARDEVKSRYRELMRHYHPDRHAGQHLSQELELLLQLKSSEINAAYHALQKQAA